MGNARSLVGLKESGDKVTVEAPKVTAEECAKLCREAGADVAIYWSFDRAKGALCPTCHWSSPELASEARTGMPWRSRSQVGQARGPLAVPLAGPDGELKPAVYAQVSSDLQIEPGASVVWWSYEEQMPIFFPEVSQLPADEYLRKDLAARCGIVSLALKPFRTGVLEIACTRPCELGDWANNMTADECRSACQDVGGSYSIYWAYDAALNVLHPADNWQPPARGGMTKAKAKAHKSEECYVTESYKFQLRPGEGAVGRAYQSKEPVFFSDVSKRTVDDYKRKDLAVKLGITSVVFRPYGEGVLEVGTAGKAAGAARVGSKGSKTPQSPGSPLRRASHSPCNGAALTAL